VTNPGSTGRLLAQPGHLAPLWRGFSRFSRFETLLSAPRLKRSWARTGSDTRPAGGLGRPTPQGGTGDHRRAQRASGGLCEPPLPRPPTDPPSHRVGGRTGGRRVRVAVRPDLTQSDREYCSDHDVRQSEYDDRLGDLDGLVNHSSQPHVWSVKALVRDTGPLAPDQPLNH
jgi:hypothetical protein